VAGVEEAADRWAGRGDSAVMAVAAVAHYLTEYWDWTFAACAMRVRAEEGDFPP
jgi:hypothetical protein